MNNKDLIPLQQSHVTQHSGSDGKTDWSVEENETNKKLYELPREWDENTVFNVLDFARVFELNALNIGINFGVSKMTEQYENKIKELNELIEGLTNSNERLAEKLGQFIGEQEE